MLTVSTREFKLEATLLETCVVLMQESFPSLKSPWLKYSKKMTLRFKKTQATRTRKTKSVVVVRTVSSSKLITKITTLEFF